MNRSLSFIVLIAIIAAHALPAAAQEIESRQEEQVSDDVELTPLETLEKAIKADVETRYELLNTISPRGVDQQQRARMVRMLIGQLDSEYPDIRARSARVLGLFEADAAPAVPALLKLIGDRQPTVTLQAVWVYASKALAAIGAEHVLEPLVAALPECDRITYYGLTATISELGDEAKSHAPIFIELLKHGPENRRWATMYTLSNLGDAALPAIPEYIKNLDHKEFNFQVMACRALAKLGSASSDAVPKLIELTGKGTMLSTRTHAAMCLGAIGPIEGVDLVQIFTDMIEEPNAFSQERGLIALGRLGRHAENTRGLVEELLAKENFSQKPEAARALWQITGNNERTLEILVKLIDNPTYDTRVQGVLKEMGPDAAPVAKLLADKLKTDDQSLRQVIVDILASIGPAAKDHVDAIRVALEDADPDTALIIDRALAKIESCLPQ